MLRHRSFGLRPALAAIAILFLFGADSFSDESQVVLRFDGLYCDKRADSDPKTGSKFTTRYLRFYDDGTVLSVTSTGSPSEVVGWFHKDNKDLSRGTYSLTGASLRFTSASPAGKVDYQGKIKGNTLELKWHSQINDKRGEEKYVFEKVDLAPRKEAFPFDALRLRPEAQVDATAGQVFKSLGQGGLVDPWKPRTNEEKPRGVEDAYARVAPATVVVRLRNGHGSGLIIDPEGWILTNHHVIADAEIDPVTRARTATVYLGTMEGGFMRLMEEGIPAVIYKSSEEKDLALLKLTRMPAKLKTLPVVALAKDGPRPGADCVAIGHPRAGMLWTLRTGVVSGVAKWPEEMLQVVMQRLALKDAGDRQKLKELLTNSPQMKVLISNCGINPGDSGGPLVNPKGELVAVTFAVPRSTGSDVALDKLAYHVHLDEVKAFLADRPKNPSQFAPDPWPPGMIVDRVDLDGDGIPDTLVFGTERERPPTGILLDLNQRSMKKFTPEQRSNPARNRAWSFEFAFHRLSEEIRVFYDTRNEGKIDLVMIDTDRDGTPDVVLHLEKDTWVKKEGKGRKMIDPALFGNEAVRERFTTIVRALSKK